MVENLIVVLIVGAAAWYAGLKYLPAKWIGRKKAAGCGSGCDTCGSGCDTPAPAPDASKYRVIKLHAR
jgi:hypothetical protein